MRIVPFFFPDNYNVSMKTPTSRDHHARTIIAGVIGNVLEWYDFALFGFLAPVLAPKFFPSESHIASLLATFGVFAIGFLMRPIGGVLFGHLGDRVGRKTALQWSVVLMAGPTTMMGLLPTYQQIGLAAPVILTLIRMAQGLSVGGEFIGSMSFLGEHAPAARRGFLGSWVTFSGALGNLIGSGVAALLTVLMPKEMLDTWGWRLPFLAGVAVGLVGLWLRLGIDETPTFKQTVQAGDRAAIPVLAALRENRIAMLLTAGLALALSIGFYLPWVWLSTWLSSINKPSLAPAESLTVNTLAMAVMSGLNPVAGALSDRLGRRPVMIAGAAGIALLAFPVFLLLSTGTVMAALQGQLILAVLASMVGGPAPAAFVELFPTHTRYSGIALAYNGTVALLGGTTPLVATSLISMTGYNLAPAFYLAGALALTALAAFWMTEQARRPLL